MLCLQPIEHECFLFGSSIMKLLNQGLILPLQVEWTYYILQDIAYSWLYTDLQIFFCYENKADRFDMCINKDGFLNIFLKSA